MTAISQGGAAQRVKVITDADLRINGGGYVLEGRAPLAVYGVSEAETQAQGGQFAVEGNIPTAVYIVESPDGVVTGNVPVPMIAVEGGLVAGNTAISVYVVAGSLGGLDPVTNLALAIGNAPANDEIDITWDAVTGADDYDIEYSTNGSDWTPVNTTALTTYSLTSADYDVDAVTHHVRVRAANTSGESDWAQATIAGWKVNVTLYANLNETSGNRATQVGGATLTDNNTVTSAAGIVSNAASFNSGNSEYLDGGDIAVAEIGAGDFSISVWNRISVSQGGNGVVIGKDNAQREWVLYFSAGSNQYVFNLFNSSDSAVLQVVSATGLSRDVWRHLVITRAGSDVYMTIDDGTPTAAAITGTPRSTSTAAFRIGDNDGNNYLYGDVDEVAIAIGRAWSAGQITALYNSGNGTTY